MSVPFSSLTDIAFDPTEITWFNELVDSYNERQHVSNPQTITFPAINVTQGDDVTSQSNILPSGGSTIRFQVAIMTTDTNPSSFSLNVRGYMDPDQPIVGETTVKQYTYDTFTTVSGMNEKGFRMAKSFNPGKDDFNKWRELDDPMFSTFFKGTLSGVGEPKFEGLIFGPWTLDDLQKAMTILKNFPKPGFFVVPPGNRNENPSFIAVDNVTVLPNVPVTYDLFAIPRARPLPPQTFVRLLENVAVPGTTEIDSITVSTDPTKFCRIFNPLIGCSTFFIEPVFVFKYDFTFSGQQN